jgi:hypothetical protein
MHTHKQVARVQPIHDNETIMHATDVMLLRRKNRISFPCRANVLRKPMNTNSVYWEASEGDLTLWNTRSIFSPYKNPPRSRYVVPSRYKRTLKTLQQASKERLSHLNDNRSFQKVSP